MKHKKFNEVYPYTYLLVRISDNTKYHGVRYANVKEGFSPENDFGKRYFTSGKLKKEFKKNPDNFYFKLSWTFDNIDEAIDHEYQVNKKIFKRKDWHNMSYGKNFGEHPDIGKLISKGRTPASVQQGVEKLKHFLYNTNEGELLRKDISERKKKYWAEKTHEEKLKILEKAHAATPEDFYTKLHEWRKEIDPETGLSRNQRIAQKGIETKRATGVDSLVGKKRNEVYDKKLKAMTDEEFDLWCEGKSLRAINGAITRRNK